MREYFRNFVIFLALLTPALPLSAIEQPLLPYSETRWVLGPLKAIQSELDLQIGGGKLRIKEGSWVPIFLEKKVVGYYLQGVGTFRYESLDTAESSVVQTTLEKNGFPAATPTGKGLSLEIPFSEACFWFDGIAELPFSGVPTPGVESSEHQPFRHFQSIFRKRGGFDLMTRMREHFLNAPSTPWEVLELKGSKGAWVFNHDPGSEKEESLSYCIERQSEVKGEGRSLQELIPVFSRPLGRSRQMTLPPEFTLTHVSMDLHAKDARNLKANVKETIQIHRTGMRAFRMQLMDRNYSVFRATGVLEPLPYRVNAVRDGQGTKLDFQQENDSILVEFAAPLDPGKPCEIQFDLEGDILVQPLGDNYWVLKDGWFPIPPLHKRAFTVNIRLKSRKPFLPLLPGTPVSLKEEGLDFIAEARIDRPVQMYWILAGKYSTIQDTRNGQTVRVASYGLDGANAKLVLDIGFDVIKYYEGFLGPFPFKDYLIAQVPQLGFGIAPPGLQLITSEAFQPFSSTANQFFTQGINHRIAHEVAHQYWPHVVHLPDTDQAWLSEAFAEYSSALFIRYSRGEGKFEQMAATWRSNAELAANLAPIGMANRLVHWPKDAWNGYWSRNHLVYDKGALILHSLRQELGDVPFLKYLRALQLNFNGKQISVEHLQGVLDAITRKDHTVFFQNYIFGTALPPK